MVKCFFKCIGSISTTQMSNGLNLLHPRKDVAEMVIVFCVSLIVPEVLMFAIKSGEHVYQESSFFVSPLSFLRFHDGIKYQCPGVTVPKCRRFWRVLKYRFALLDHPETCDLMTPAKVHPVHDRHNFCWSTWATLVKIFGAFPPKVWCKTSQQTIDLKPQI